jgi:spore coat polysaccharide biosynthesis protein SpsF (cytidylyltransferase family)
VTSTLGLIQARMTSERLPGKVLVDIGGQTMLERVVRRVQQSQRITGVIVATTTNPADEAIVAESERLGVRSIRGSEEDVLGRFADAANAVGGDVFVRISADSPFIDADVIDLIINRFISADPPVDYASNKLEPTFPLGLDAEVFSRAALLRTAEEAKEPYERSHVTVYMYQHPELFQLLAVKSSRDLHSWRWTVDTPEDLEFARAVFERLDGRNDFSWLEVVEVLERDPSLASINAHVSAKPLTEG